MRFWDECGVFFRQFRRSFHTTGAILPSGWFLASALAAPLRRRRGPARILEVGPGTGSVTRAIARCLGRDDRLDAVEINAHFVRVLEERLDREPAFADHRDRIHVIHAGVEDLLGESVYDYIVSGLPLNNFSVDEVRTVFAAFRRLLKPDGILTYYDYLLVRQLKTPFVDRQERRRLRRVGRVVNWYIRDCQVRRQRIFINVPPATVRHLCLKPSTLSPVPVPVPVGMAP
jgi:phospholipid N-methyltransferase